jgi:hypothetical protein
VTSWCEVWVAVQFRKAHGEQAKSVIISSFLFVLYSEVAARVEPYVMHWTLATIHEGTGTMYLQSSNFDFYNMVYGLSLCLVFISAVRFSLAVLHWRTIAKLHVKEIRKIKEMEGGI